MNLPPLYHKSKTGKIMMKKISADGADIVTEYGHIGDKVQTSRRTAVAKNVGRSNATTAEEQAIAEAKADWEHDLKRKYSESIEDAHDVVFLPMTGKTFKDEKLNKKTGERITVLGKGIRYPCLIQPKLDGARAMCFRDEPEIPEIYMGTRSGQEWLAPQHIKKELEKLLPAKCVIDGEFYIHGTAFEDIISWSKKVHPHTANLEYHVFDLPIDDNGVSRLQYDRIKDLGKWFKENVGPDSPIKLVPTFIANNEKEALAFEEQFLSQGYEGAIARNMMAEYKFGEKTSQMQKLKSCMDAEFEIVGFKSGIGRDKNCVIWICKTHDGSDTFDPRPKASLEQRKLWYKEAEQGHHIGKMLKVEFQNYSAYGVPRFPRSLGFRDPIDMPPPKKKK